MEALWGERPLYHAAASRPRERPKKEKPKKKVKSASTFILHENLSELDLLYVANVIAEEQARNDGY